MPAPAVPEGDARSGGESTPRTPPARSLLLLLRGFFVLLGTLPWWIPIARARLSLGGFGAALDHLFVTMCHRLPERSLVLSGVQMPVCSRCAGIFAGIALGAVIARPRLSTEAWRAVLIGIGVLMALDVATQDLGLHPVWHPTRLATGAALGFGMAASFVAYLARPRSAPG